MLRKAYRRRDLMSDLWTDMWTNAWGEAVALRRMFDAAYPPASPPKWEVAAGYIGGNTPHVWTDQEWARQQARWRLPIFTRSTGGDPVADAGATVGWLRAHGVPKGVCVALDFETRINAVYLYTFDQAVMDAGWRVMVYGSLGTVISNPKPSGGYWVADWPPPGETAHPHLVAGSAATQWSGSGPFGGAYDPNLVADSTPLWDTQGDLSMADAQDILNAIADLKTTVQNGLGTVIRGDVTTDPAKDTHPDSIQRTRQDLAAGLSDISTRIDTLASKVGQTIDPTAVATLLAGQLEITGIQTDPIGVITITFGPRVVP